MPECQRGRRTAWTKFFCWLSRFTKSLCYWRIHIRKFHPGSLQEVRDAGLAGSRGMETQGFRLTSLIHTFPFYSIFSALQPRLGTEDSWENEVGMTAKLARGWGPFTLHVHRCCIPYLAATAKRNTEFGEEQRSAPRNPSLRTRDAQGSAERLGCPHPSQPVSLRVHFLRSVLITAVSGTFDSVFLSEKVPLSLAQHSYYLPT